MIYKTVEEVDKDLETTLFGIKKVYEAIAQKQASLSELMMRRDRLVELKQELCEHSNISTYGFNNAPIHYCTDCGKEL